MNVQPAPNYHTKGCSHSSADSPGARTLDLSVPHRVLQGAAQRGAQFYFILAVLRAEKLKGTN